MLVETAVLDREHRFDHRLGDHLEGHVAALLARVGDERRDEWSVERDPIGRVLVAGSSIVSIRVVSVLFGGRPPNDQAHQLSLVIAVARDQHMASRPTVNSPGCSGARTMGVAEIVQPIDELPLGEP